MADPPMTVREMARLGGLARRTRLGPRRRSRIARMGGIARGRLPPRRLREIAARAAASRREAARAAERIEENFRRVSILFDLRRRSEAGIG